MRCSCPRPSTIMTTTTTTDPDPIAVDLNGADGGPDLVAEGARLAGTPVTPFGGEAITNDEDPALAVRGKPDASVVRAAKAVGAGEADALVSAGATGALLAASLFHVKRIQGVHRPGDRGARPAAGQARPPARRGRERGRPARVPRAVRVHGRGLHGGGARRRHARASACSRSGKRRRRAPTTSSRRTRSSPRGRSTSPATSRARTWRQAQWTWWSPTASPATSRSS